jgi:hypothetical protein
MSTTDTSIESRAPDGAAGPELNGTQTWAICCSGGSVRSASYKPDHRSDRWWHALGLWLWYVLPHPLWRRGDAARARKEARLWAYVLKLRSRDSTLEQLYDGAEFDAYRELGAAAATLALQQSRLSPSRRSAPAG